ncbi:Dynein light chain 1, axonemal [Larimichthys crocea]|uniref:Dynein axonemal light chain 1 n=1 Tax=Larimichthys crocea TaxID=215358 RepID=A0A6G0IE06_LARCR|nr:Dynein light chain 1, axonemal [Larimichthys crocea]
MDKPTTVKQAIAKWEKKSEQTASEATEVLLYGQIPPLEKLDASLSTLSNCEKLSLSTNCITKITNLGSLKNLKILSLGRNNIKTFDGLDAVSDTLEELWISYNSIEKMKGIQNMKKLRVLHMLHNLVKEWKEFERLADLLCLEDLRFIGNPLEDKESAQGTWRDNVSKRLPRLKKLDGVLIIRQEVAEGGD